MNNGVITINMKGRELKLVKDHNIYEVFYKGHNVGYFAKHNLEDAKKKIVEDGFFDGKSYLRRVVDVDEKLGKSWGNFLTHIGMCSQDEVGNRPCDNGVYCSKCNEDWVHEEYIEWLRR